MLPEASVEPQVKPDIGLVFESFDRAYNFYNAYGRQIGFSIRKDYRNKNPDTGEITSARFVCCKEGFRGKDKRDHFTKEPRAENRTGYGASMRIKLDRKKKVLVVDMFEEEHNHPLFTKYCTHLMRSQRKISGVQSIEVVMADDSGIRIGSAFEFMGRETGAREAIGFTKIDQKNYLRTRRQKHLEFGEAGCILDYFQTQQLENPSFFHVVQLDNNELMTNIFWSDARMIIDYAYFGDVVTFDTTYKVNNANRPFGVFIGLNHHRETVIFGAALMYDETADSFVWLFETFLKAMSHKTPKTILTDQDGAMSKALALVMPETNHHLCTWHIMQNALKHVAHLSYGDENITSMLSKFMKNIDEENEFLSNWDDMLDKFSGHDNKWLSNLFELRTKWAKEFVKHCWCAGMRSTQLSESFNSSLKDYLKSDHSLPDFFKHFDRIVRDKRYNEIQAEYELCQKLPRVKLQSSTMLLQASELYTNAIFQRFQKQFEKSVEAYVKEQSRHNQDLIYTVVVFCGHRSERQVRRRGDDNFLIYSCGKFEMEGIACSHIIKILKEHLHATELPVEYINKRWTRDARNGKVLDFIGREVHPDPKLQACYRFKTLCHLYLSINSFASESEHNYNLCVTSAEQLLKMFEDARSQRMDMHDGPLSTSQATETVEDSVSLDQSGRDASSTRTTQIPKGFKKRNTGRGQKCRYKSVLESPSQRAKKSKPRAPKAKAKAKHPIEGTHITNIVGEIPSTSMTCEFLQTNNQNMSSQASYCPYNFSQVTRSNYRVNGNAEEPANIDDLVWPFDLNIG